MGRTYPYLNKSLADMRGEEWKDIPGFEGYYQASNLGRIRSLDRVVPHPRWGRQFVEGRVLSQSLSKNRNIKTGEPTIDLRVSLNLDGTAHYYNVRRLVYICFIDSKLDYSSDGLYIINKDGNGYNNRAGNLKAVTKSEKQKRAYRRDRIDSYLKTADRSAWPVHGGHARRKPVKQYDLNGTLIETFESVSEASRQTHFDEKAIIDVAKGKYKQWKGFKWEYANKQ